MGDEDLSAEYLFDWLDNLAAYCGARLLRTKGIVRLNELDGAVLIQSVGTIFDPPRKIAKNAHVPTNSIVIIARDLDVAELETIEPTLQFQFRDTHRRRAFVCSEISLMHDQQQAKA